MLLEYLLCFHLCANPTNSPTSGPLAPNLLFYLNTTPRTCANQLVFPVSDLAQSALQVPLCMPGATFHLQTEQLPSQSAYPPQAKSRRPSEATPWPSTLWGMTLEERIGLAWSPISFNDRPLLYALLRTIVKMRNDLKLNHTKKFCSQILKV